MKKGISLIVLVITIIVMIIIAGAIIISLNSTDVINRSNEAVESSNAAELRSAVALEFSNLYIAHIKGIQDGTVTKGEEGPKAVDVLKDEVVTNLLQKVNNNQSGNVYSVVDGEDGVYVLVKDKTGATLQNY